MLQLLLLCRFFFIFISRFSGKVLRIADSRGAWGLSLVSCVCSTASLRRRQTGSVIIFGGKNCQCAGVGRAVACTTAVAALAIVVVVVAAAAVLAVIVVAGIVLGGLRA